MATNGAHSVRTSTRVAGPALLIGLYFAALAIIVRIVRRQTPWLEPYLPFGGIDNLSAGTTPDLIPESHDEIVTTFVRGVTDQNFDAITLALAVTGAMLLMVPISWVYFITTRSKKVDRSFAQTIIVLPIIVAGIATIVQNSLALAFSLAGIVAAVRFRFTLNEPAHALYIFVAITVGLAAGIGALGIAYVTAVAFVVVNLTLWRINYGANLTTAFFAFLTGRGRDDNEL